MKIRPIAFKEDYALVELTKGKFSKVDKEDVNFINMCNWHADTTGYARNCKYGQMHRIINKTPAGYQTDHINGNRLDNRKSNLRTATVNQNQYNQRNQRGRTSRFKGVGWRKCKKLWRAYIKNFGVDKHLGYFKTEEEAAKRYNEEARKIFGRFAKLNAV